MTFNSIAFAYFLPVVLLGYFLFPVRARVPWILAASYYFYGYWSIPYLGLLVATMLLDYAAAILIERAGTPAARRNLLVFSLVLNLGVLFLFKYFDLVTGLIAEVLHVPAPKLGLELPFGLSFYTFHSMSYVIDVYRRLIPAERSFVHYSSYVMFFPQLVAGPIARASHLLPQFRNPAPVDRAAIIDGAYLVAKGFFLKVVLADTFGGFVDAQFGSDAARTPLLMSQAVYFFALQIYCDFSGYTSIARGIARWFGYDLTENFRTPYFSASFSEFWRRWHISLSSWLRDYLYIPLGGSKGGKFRTYRNLMITMGLGGLWHGGSWTFLAWGVLHGGYLVVEKALADTAVGRGIARLPRPVRVLGVFHLVCFAWIFFRAASFADASAILGAVGTLATHPLRYFATSQIVVKLWALALLLLSYEALEGRFRLPVRFAAAPWPLRFALLYGAIAVIALLAEVNPRTFLYFQF